MKAKIAVLPATYRTAEKQIRKALDLLDYCPQREKILLKPNLVAVPRWLPLGGISRAAITDLRFIEALLRIFDDHEITIAEGTPAHDTDAVLEKTGVTALARRYGAKVVNLDEAERYEAEWAYGKLRLPRLLQTHEYVNVPKLKTHLMTGVTLGCKNQKGLLTNADRIRFHRQLDVHTAIDALADAVQPALTIVDGVVGMEGAGPTQGRPRRSHAIVAGRDVRAADVACCDLMSVQLERVQHLKRLPYQTVGSTIEELQLHFSAPTKMVVANTHIHVSARTCSRCLLSIHEGNVVFWRSPTLLLRGTWNCILHRTDIIMGQTDEVPACVRGRIVCYGDCTRELAEAHDLQFIPGCPPAVKESLKMY
jgi:uncharacterized protein (DUF362 family)